MSRNSVRRSLLTCVVVSGCLLGSVAAWKALVAAEERDLATHFELYALEHARAIEHRLSDSLGAVEALAALQVASETVTSEDFRLVASGLLAKDRSLDGLSWNPRISHAERLRIEASCQAPAPSPCRVTERDARGELVPAGPREHYTVVRLIEPFPGNAAALGYDVESERRRRAALARASRSGKISLTAPIRLVQDEVGWMGFLAFHPVYRKGAPVKTREEREAGIAGFVVGVFHVADLVESALEGLGIGGLDLYLHDAGEPPDASHLYARHAQGDGGGPWIDLPWRADAESLAVVATVDAGDRSWRARFVPTPAAVAAHRTAVPGAVLALGLVLTAGIATHLLRLASANEELAREVAQREQAEAAARLSEERCRTTIDALTDGGWDWNMATGDVYFSDSWLESLGYSREEIEPTVGFWKSLLHPDDVLDAEQALAAHVEGNTPAYECVNRLRKRSGEYRWNLDHGAVVEWDAEGRPLRMVGTDTDITERRRAEEERRRLDAKLQHSQKLESLGVLAGGIAHDFNNLLVGILGNADLALSDSACGSQCRSEVDQIRVAATRAAELTRQMLAYAGKARFVQEEIDLSRLVREMVHLLEASVPKRTKIDYGLSASQERVEGDATQIRQVVMNLITNAADSLAGHGGVVSVRTSVRELGRRFLGGADLDASDGPGRFACLEVRDSGCGMDEDTRRRIFDPFFTTKLQGRGLGLAAVLGIVRGHRGLIHVESAPGRGTVFQVAFPISRAKKLQPAVVPAAAEPGWPDGGTVLVVDDEAPVRLLAARALQKLGFEVVAAEDGDEALEVARGHSGDLRAVILDLTMPGRSSPDTLRELRSVCDAPVILSSGYAAEECLSEFGNDPPVGFLQKPYGAADLAEVLRAALGE